MKIIISGGHLTPALAFIETAISNADKLLMLGSAKPNSPELIETQKLSIEYVSIYPVKLNRFKLFSSILSLPLFIIPVYQSFLTMLRFKPDVVISFGGYSGLHVGLAAFLLHIPIILHEQTRSIGLANKILCRFAVRCGLSYTTSLKYFPLGKSIVVGNLLRRVFWNPSTDSVINLPTSKPIMLITGGNQGSYTIVQLIIDLLSELTPKYQLVIQSGRCILDPVIIAKYKLYVQSWFTTEQIVDLYRQAEIIITRSGANTIAELIALKCPAIVIPLPHTSNSEQYQNAAVLANHQAGIMITQSKLTHNSLMTAITEYTKLKQQFTQNIAQIPTLTSSTSVDKFYDLVSLSVKRNS